MNITVLSKVLLVLIAHSCVTVIVAQASEAEHLTPIYEAGIDILMSCYGDLHNTVGIVGDSDGSILQALRSKYLMPVVLIDVTSTTSNVVMSPSLHRLNVFVIATEESGSQFAPLLLGLRNSIWWNSNANFLMLDTTPDADRQCSKRNLYMLITKYYGLLNTHFICFDREMRQTVIMNSNPFTPYAPKTWALSNEVKSRIYPPFYVFVRTYQKGGRNCEDLNFSKTRNIGGYPLHFRVSEYTAYMLTEHFQKEVQKGNNDMEKFIASNLVDTHLWFMMNLVTALNATAKVNTDHQSNMISVELSPRFLSHATANETDFERCIFSAWKMSFVAITQHTSHKSQLEKLRTVIDSTSRIGLCLVYLVTFLFFKFFLGQAIAPAILDLVRLTCNTGLTKLPKNLAPTIYLACLFGFVVTLQGIYTGNLATLLTTTIAYPHVNTIQDIAKLGYTAYVSENYYAKFASLPSLEGRVKTLKAPDDDRAGAFEEMCAKYVLSNPLAVWFMDDLIAIYAADIWNLHISRDTILEDYTLYSISDNNPLGGRIHEIISLWTENGLRRQDIRIERLRLQFVDDYAVRKNTSRRVMTLDDLRFAFVILIVGLACSLTCFISELVVFRVRLKMAKRRDRTRARLAWGPTEKNYFWTLNFRFDPRRLFSKRR